MATPRIGPRSTRAITVVCTSLLAVAAMSASAPRAVAAGASAKTNGFVQIAGDTPRAVADHVVASAVHAHDERASLALNVGLAVRNSAELDAVIAAASTPGSPSYGHYLTPAQYDARYAPTDATVATVRQWLESEGVRVTAVSPDNLIVSAQADTATAERAFRVTIADYHDGARTFFSNDVAPSVPAGAGIQWVTGLNDYAVARASAQPTPAFRTGGYYPGDFQTGYHTGGAPTTQTIGFTLWGAPMQQADLTNFATHTTTTPITINQVGANGLDFIPCSTASCNPAGAPDGDTSVLDETALDVESAHGIAPGSHLKYWLASTSGGHPYQASLENAVNAAANDPTARIISNSWGIPADDFDPPIDTSLQHGAAIGKTFFFSTGDTPDISYPATSPYVVAVGGTTLNLNGSFAYVSESAWSSAGLGCSGVFKRPSWQVGVGSAPTCPGRAEPDVSADAAPSSGAYVRYDGIDDQIGGTSLATPLWAGMAAVWNQARLNASKPVLGFLAPLLYAFGNNPSVYHHVFHDVTTGFTGGVAAEAGWDEATGWGSPDLGTMIATDLALTPTTTTLTTSKNPVAFNSTVTLSATVSPAPTGGTLTFRRNGAAITGCFEKPISAGHASCTTKLSQSGTLAMIAYYSGNGLSAGSTSHTVSQVVNPGPGYWMVGSTGAVYAFGSAAAHGNANTSGVSHFEPTPSRAGYWIVNRSGQVFAFGTAHNLGGATGLLSGETVSSLSSTPSGNGYWLFTSLGRVMARGDAHFYGDMSGRHLNGPVIGSIATPTGHGYYMVASDGGIFSFGDAAFHGSTGALKLNRPVNGLVPTATNHGYWLVASDGGIFAFGDAVFRGSMGHRHLNRPVVGMVRYGNGYLMVGSDGGIFDFSDQPFLGSLGDRTLPAPIVSVAS